LPVDLFSLDKLQSGCKVALLSRTHAVFGRNEARLNRPRSDPNEKITYKAF